MIDIFSTLWAEALTDNNREAYISDWALSSIWTDEPESEIPAERIKHLGQIWDAAHMSIKEICKAANLTQAALERRYGIPRRTVANWCTETNKCPDYTRLLIMLDLGLIKR